jgi:protoheme ferro-lyase
MNYDAILLVSFGGPECNSDVLPFLENVLRDRNVPRERMLQVAERYYLFGGKSPINDQNRALIAALGAELKTHGPDLPIYWGNRNWHPMLADTLRQMKTDGVKRANAFATSAYSSYSSCRQYRENIATAQTAVGDGAPAVHKLRVFYNHPYFVEANIDHVREALKRIPEDRRASPTPRTVFRWACRRVATISVRFWKLDGWFPRPWNARPTHWSSRVEAVRLRSRGWSRTSSITCANSSNKARRMW